MTAAPPVTQSMLRDLKILRNSKRKGCILARGAYRSEAGRIGEIDAACLVVPGLASKSFNGRHPRLHITRAGMQRLAELCPRTV